MLNEHLFWGGDNGKMIYEVVVGERVGVYHALERRPGTEGRLPKGHRPFESVAFWQPTLPKAILALLKL